MRKEAYLLVVGNCRRSCSFVPDQRFLLFRTKCLLFSVSWVNTLIVPVKHLFKVIRQCKQTFKAPTSKDTYILSNKILYRVSQKKWPDFTISYLKKYWIWRLQIFYSNSTWVEIVYWKIFCDHLNPFKLCWYLKISKFLAL